MNIINTKKLKQNNISKREMPKGMDRQKEQGLLVGLQSLKALC